MSHAQSFWEFLQVAIIGGVVLGLLIWIANKETDVTEAITLIFSMIILLCIVRFFL